MHDRKTVEYFNRNLHEYSLERMEYVVSVLGAVGRPGDSLVDIGCGAGNTIEMLGRETPLTDFAGIDASENYVRMTRERNGCRAYHGSILDSAFVASVPERFDFALLASVLHHLIGRTRRESSSFAVQAVGNAMELLKPGGALFIVETAFSPPFLMDILFHMKKIVSRFISGRMELGASWYNIGPPVVSYYTNEQLIGMIGSMEGAELADSEIREKRVRAFPMRLLGRTNTTLVVRKRG